MGPRPIDAVADDFIGTGAARKPTPSRGTEHGRRERGEADAFLRELLACGPMPVPEVKKAVAGTEFSWATVKRAKDEAGITGKSKPGEFIAGKKPPRWWGIGDDWEFPPEAAPPPEPTDEPPTSQAGEPVRDGGASNRQKPLRNPNRLTRKSELSLFGGRRPGNRERAHDATMLSLFENPRRNRAFLPNRLNTKVRLGTPQPELPFDDSADSDR